MIDKVMADFGRRRACRSGRRRARAPRGCRGRRCPAIRAAVFPRPASRRSANRRRGWSAARYPARPPSPRRNARRRSRSRTLPQTTASSRRRARRDARRRSGGTCPGSGADARSADRAAAAGRRAAARSRARRSDRPGGPSASTWPASVPAPGWSNDADLLARHEPLKTSRFLPVDFRRTLISWHARCQENYRVIISI